MFTKWTLNHIKQKGTLESNAASSKIPDQSNAFMNLHSPVSAYIERKSVCVKASESECNMVDAVVSLSLNNFLDSLF